MAQKMPSFFFRELQLITVLLLNCDSYMGWSTRFVSLKLCVGLFIFGSVSFYSSLINIFWSTKCMDYLNVKRHNFFQNQSNAKATHTFARRPLIFKLQKEFLKFNDICMSCSSANTDLVTRFLNEKLEKKTEKVSFSQ